MTPTPPSSTLEKYPSDTIFYELNKLNKKSYVSINSLVEGFVQSKESFEYPEQKLFITNLLKRKDLDDLTLQNRIFLYLNKAILVSRLLKPQLFELLLKGIQDVNLRAMVMCRNHNNDHNHLRITNPNDIAIVHLFPEIESLEVSFKISDGDDEDDKYLKTLADAKLNLRQLTFSNGDFKGHGFAHIIGMPLKHICLNGSILKDISLEYISKITSLTTLDIGDTTITDQGLSYLENAKNIEVLNVIATDTTSEGIRYLINLNLKELHLEMHDDRNIDDYLPHLCKIKTLKRLCIYFLKATSQQLSALSDLPVAIASLRQGLRENYVCPPISDLLAFARAIKEKHNINVLIETGTVLEWQNLELDENNEFDISENVRVDPPMYQKQLALST